MKPRNAVSKIVFNLSKALLLYCFIVMRNPGQDAPAHLSSPPEGAIGYPNRDENFDVLPGFKTPPAGYGEVAFYWWLGDPLTKERLSWQIEQLAKSKGVMGLQINYAHSDRGGKSYGLTYPGQPPLFSKEWWDLVAWFIKTAKTNNMSVSLSDYTLGIGQGWIMDEILKENPDLNGSVLKCETRDITGKIEWSLPENNLYVCAFTLSTNNEILPDSKIDLQTCIRDRVLVWDPPSQTNKYRIAVVYYQIIVPSLDPMNPKSGSIYADRFFGQFEKHFPDECGKGLNFFFSDELEFGVRGKLWTKRFAGEFKKRKGYDIIPQLPSLFLNTGSTAIKTRLDYSDVKVALTEEGFFKPVFEWHQNRGMIYGCDHGGRGRDVVEFGDYFRTQRWNQGPGCDQPGLSRDIVKNKVASSIAHLYLRPRVWLEGYYGSGWGTTSEQITDATFANFAQGQNLLTFHGLYYSTHGGWWEWAPPCNHFRQPYWEHIEPFMKCLQRLSFVLSQGYHRCDVAILYPVAPMEAELDGNSAVTTAFNTAQTLYKSGIDFDFMDFESLNRAEITGNQLQVSGEAYRVIILPSMRAIRYSNLEKALRFHRAGGLVLAIGSLPEASDRIGSNDPLIANINREIFGSGSNRFDSPQSLVNFVSSAFSRDFNLLTPQTNAVNFIHRKIGKRDVYMIYGATKGSLCELRAIGNVQLWDPWTGEVTPLSVVSQSTNITRIQLPLTEKEPQLIVFTPGDPQLRTERQIQKETIIPIEDSWEFELKPTMFNRFGDYRIPAFDGYIGAEARRFRYKDEDEFNPEFAKPDFDDSDWQKITYSFGCKFYKLGAFSDDSDTTGLESQLAEISAIDPYEPVEFKGKSYRWKPVEFSWRWGIEKDPGHQGYHGLKGIVHDELFALGKPRPTATDTIYGPEPEGTRYYLWTTIYSPALQSMNAFIATGAIKPSAIWLNSKQYSQPLPQAVSLKQGVNTLLIRYDKPGRTFIVFKTKPHDDSVEHPFTKNACWIWYPQDSIAAAERFFRKVFTLKNLSAATLRVTCDNEYSIWLNGDLIGSGKKWDIIDEYEITKNLRPGNNVIAIKARNEGDAAGLIAEIQFDNGNNLSTDSSWRCSATVENEKWLNLDFDDRNWSASQEIATFENSLWYNHIHGPPKLQRSEKDKTLLPQPTLASGWYNDTSLLRFDVRPATKTPAGWYRFRAAPGLKSLLVTCLGTPRVWIDGVEVSGNKEPDKNCVWRFSSSIPVKRSPVVAIRIEQQRGEYGGSAILEPIMLECEKGTIDVGDWSRYDGLECYSGGAWYRKSVYLENASASRVILDLGKVVASAQAFVNGTNAGIRVSSPYQFDITKWIKPGNNKIELLIYNTAGNHYSTIPTRYRGTTESGLFGPVTIHFFE